MRRAPPKEPLDLPTVERITQQNRRSIAELSQRAAACDHDDESQERHKAHQCRLCFYHRRGGIVGHAFTTWTCWSCGDERQHPNTGTPKICDTCSEKLRLCVSCGADIQLLHREKL